MFERLIRNQERHARLMGEMMRRHGVLEAGDISITGAMELERASRICMGCGTVEECERWMAETTGTEGASAFCPNVRTFTKLAH